jgi:hypothetical protein
VQIIDPLRSRLAQERVERRDGVTASLRVDPDETDLVVLRPALVVGAHPLEHREHFLGTPRPEAQAREHFYGVPGAVTDVRVDGRARRRTRLHRETEDSSIICQGSSVRRHGIGPERRKARWR